MTFRRCTSAALVLSFLFALTAHPASSAPAPTLSPSPAPLPSGAPKIVSVDISGNTHVPTASIMAVVQSRPGQPYDPKVVQGDIERISSLGYFADQATPLIRQRPGGIAITYRVIENPVITKIVFSGNNKVPSDTLLALMDTSVGQVLNQNTLREDFLKINSYYDRIGYSGQIPSHVTDLDTSQLFKTGQLTIDITEGLTIAGPVRLGGANIMPPNLVLSKIQAKPGVEWSDAMGQQDCKTISDLYDKYNLVLGQCIPGIDPTTINTTNNTVQVKYDLWPARVGLVQVTGNTKTKDLVVRRELTLRPGMIITKAGILRDEDNLNNTGFFSKVSVDPKSCPDAMMKTDPGCTVLDWNVTEQKTASAQIGAGYSGGLTGQGLYGTLGYTDNNLHGTGNSVSMQLEQGAVTSVATLGFSIPYFGNTAKSQLYNVGANIFTQRYRYFYPVYSTSGTTTTTSGPIPVTLLDTGGASLLSGTDATSISKNSGVQFLVGRRLGATQALQAGVSVQISRIENSTTVPSPYYFPSTQPNLLVGPTPGPLNSYTQNTGSFGIQATSLANINTGAPYQLNVVSFTLGANKSRTVDDIFNPRVGGYFTFTEDLSAPVFGSNFLFTRSLLDVAKFFPVLRTSTLAMHAQAQTSTGVIPPIDLFTFSDQNLRGYNSVFYGTSTVLGQVEFRQPLTADRKFSLAIFGDEGGYLIRGASPELDPYTNRIIGYPGLWTYRGDYGIGLRFDVPQLNLHTIRIDFAKGSMGTHTSFGIGQSF